MNLSTLQLSNSLGNSLLGHGELFNDRLASVQSGKLQHLPVNRSGSDQRPLDGDSVGEEGHVGDGKVTLGDTERVDARSGLHKGEDEFPIGLSRGGDEQSVELGSVRQVLGLLVLHGEEVVSTESGSLVLFGVGSRETDDSTTHLVGELDGQVSQTSHSHDSDHIGRSSTLQRGEYGSTSTLQRRSILIRQTLGDRVKESFPPNGTLGERSLVGRSVTVHGSLGAKDLFSLETLEAVETSVGLVSPSDSVALLEELAVRSEGLDDPDSFVTENHVVLQL